MKPIDPRAKRLSDMLNRFRRQSAKHTLSPESLKQLKWAKEKLLPQRLFKAWQNGILDDVVRAQRRSRFRDTDSRRHVFNAVAALYSAKRPFDIKNDVMKKLRDTLPRNQVPPLRTVYYFAREYSFPHGERRGRPRGSKNQRIER
jgi:hypothetical protein